MNFVGMVPAGFPVWNGVLDQLASMAFPDFRSILFTTIFEDAILVIWFTTSAQEGLPHVVPQGTGMLGVTCPPVSYLLSHHPLQASVGLCYGSAQSCSVKAQSS